MISKEEIKRLADLARIEIADSEIQNLSQEMDAILDYVGQVKSITGKEPSGVDVGPVYNVMREDENPTAPGAYHRELIAEFPNKDGDYLKVKKIL
jgi:aspartyl-tRNA(Asn)/glutamyl-tRNA(Gln) amidotransferase subunit C